MTAASTPAADPDRSRRVELLLHQLERLPTVGAIALRALELGAAEHSSADQLLEIASSDPALAARLVLLARRGHEAPMTTLGQAIEWLGPQRVRAELLSVDVQELHDGAVSPGGERSTAATTFCPRALWRHSVAVATLCRDLAGEIDAETPIDHDEAYLAGLLHDAGMLALHALLPRSLDEACRLAEEGRSPLPSICRRLLGTTPHAAGRLLAEHWWLPHRLGDAIWLHGQPAASLPDLPHRRLIELVGLADAAMRAADVRPPGHRPGGEDLQTMAESLGLQERHVRELATAAGESARLRAGELGLDEPAQPRSLARAMATAARTLGRLHQAALDQAAVRGRRARTLEAIAAFHDALATGGSLVAVLGKVIRSAHQELGGSLYAVVLQPRPVDPWQMLRFAPDGRLQASEVVAPPAGSAGLADLADDLQVSMQALHLLPWLADLTDRGTEPSRVRLLPLRCGWGVSAVLVHDGPAGAAPGRLELAALGRTWSAAVVAACHHAGARALGERLAEANRDLVRVQDELAQREALATLGEVAAGAAHEMNNPLTVISGRAQLLANRIEEPDHRAMAQQIVAQSHRLSDMISSLRSFAEPVAPEIQAVDPAALLETQVQALYRDWRDQVDVQLVVDQGVRRIHVDPEQIGRAVRELLRNAAESQGCHHIEVRVQIDPLDDRLQIQVADDGEGLSQHALAHAFDPFFSDKSAGRQPGLGLSHARRLVLAHGGRIALENTPRGATATIRLPGWKGGGAPGARREDGGRIGGAAA